MLKPVFNVPPVFFGAGSSDLNSGVLCVSLNVPMARLLSNVIHELEGDREPELVAFGLRLHNLVNGRKDG